MKLTDYTTYADAWHHFSKDGLWALFDGDRGMLNITDECLSRHPPETTAVRIAHADGRDEAFTFGELSDWSNRFANYLHNQGVGKGDRIAFMLDPSLAFYMGLFGAMKAGCVAVPLFTLFGTDGLRQRIDDCTPRLLLVAPGASAATAQLEHVDVIAVDDRFMARVAAESPAAAMQSSADDIAMYQYTSGTSRDLPEAVRHRHRALVTVMIAALYGTGVRPGDVFMCPSSPAWGHGLWHGTLAPLALGVPIASYAGRFDPHRLMQAIEAYEITNLSAAATHYRLMKNTGDAASFRYSVEKASFTGEAMDSDTAAWAAEVFGTPARSIYGTTEVGVILANYPGAADFLVKPGALGKPVPGVELAVLDALGNPCPADVIGEIMVRRQDAWVPTRDRGHVDGDGYFYHDGRADDVIISAGWTISPVEIEDTLLSHPDVDEAAVIGVPDDVRGAAIKAYIVSRRPGDEVFTKELQDYTRERLSKHEYPRHVVYAPSLPKTSAGKVNRRALRDNEQLTNTKDLP